jgi:hypothetical protein
MIKNCAAQITIKYNMSILGVLRTGVSSAEHMYSAQVERAHADPPLTAGVVGPIQGDHYFLGA